MKRLVIVFGLLLGVATYAQRAGGQAPAGEPGQNAPPGGGRGRGQSPEQQAAAAAQAQAFENFIASTPCLNSQRGRIMERNSCRNPWINQIDVSFAQSLRALRFQNIQVRLDIINFGNLLNKNWGKQSFSDQNSTCGQICSATVVLTQTGNKLPGTATSSQEATGVYTFDQKYKLFSSDFAGSNYQMQLSMRYSF